MVERSIKALDAEVIKMIHSQTNICDIVGCVSELVQNAIDAKATNISIVLNMPQLSVIVSDDGSGIQPFDMDQIGQHYYTSKCTSFDDLASISTFGFRGEALASIAAASLLSITSRHVDYTMTRTAKFFNSKRIISGLSSDKLSNHGTIVSIDNMFSNMPVRRKHLLSIPEGSHIQNIKELLVQFAVVKPDLSIILRRYTGDVILSIGAHSKGYSFPREVQVLQSVYGASLASEWDTVDAKSAKISVHGVFSLSPVASKSSQYIILNRRLTYVGNLFKYINDAFRLSSYIRDLNLEFKAKSQKNLTPSRPFAKYPAFILSISCPQVCSDICQDPSKVIYRSAYESEIVFTVKALCKKFLQVHNFLTEINDVPIVKNSLKRRYHSDKDFLKKGSCSCQVPNLNDPEMNMLMSNVGMAIYDPKKVQGRGTTINRVEIINENRPQAMISKKLRITEFMKSAKPGNNDSSKPDNKLKAIGEWITPTFTLVEKYIPSLDTKAVNGAKGFLNSSHFFSEASSDRPSEIKIAREDLKGHTVIAQVGEKFIMDKIYVEKCGTREPLLLLIDQHAADERIRVERYIYDYLTDKCFDDGNCVKKDIRYKLPTVVEIEMTIKETALVQQYKESIMQWGTLYEIVNFDKSAPQLLKITHIPSIAIDKSLDLTFLKRLIIKHAYDIDENKASKKLITDGNLWWTKLRSIPDALLELINSKACRSSIMFGEKLEPSECDDLINKLAECKFPFQCAHGRPSMIPLVDLSISDRQKNNVSNSQEVVEEIEYQLFSGERPF